MSPQSVLLVLGMGKTTEWQVSWGQLVDQNGDKYEEYLVKQDDEYVKCR